MLKLYMTEGHGFILVYSIIAVSTLECLPGIYEKILQVKKEHVPIILVGNKCDLEEQRVVPFADGQHLASKFNTICMEISAKENIHVEQAFNHLIHEIVKTRKASPTKMNCTVM